MLTKLIHEKDKNNEQLSKIRGHEEEIRQVGVKES